MFIAYAQTFADVSIEARVLFGLNLNLHPYFMYASNDSDVISTVTTTTNKQIRITHIIIYKVMKYRKLLLNT